MHLRERKPQCDLCGTTQANIWGQEWQGLTRRFGVQLHPGFVFSRRSHRLLRFLCVQDNPPSIGVGFHSRIPDAWSAEQQGQILRLLKPHGCSGEQFFCQPMVNEGLVCVAFRDLRPWSFCRLGRQIPKTRVARLDDVAFATPPSPRSGKLCPIVTQFRVHSGYFDSDPQSLALPYVPPNNYLCFQQHSRFLGLSAFVFIHIPASVSGFPQRPFVFIHIPALLVYFLKLLRLDRTGRQ